MLHIPFLSAGDMIVQIVLLFPSLAPSTVDPEHSSVVVLFSLVQRGNQEDNRHLWGPPVLNPISHKDTPPTKIYLESP